MSREKIVRLYAFLLIVLAPYAAALAARHVPVEILSRKDLKTFHALTAKAMDGRIFEYRNFQKRTFQESLPVTWMTRSSNGEANSWMRTSLDVKGKTSVRDARLPRMVVLRDHSAAKQGMSATKRRAERFVFDSKGRFLYGYGPAVKIGEKTFRQKYAASTLSGHPELRATLLNHLRPMLTRLYKFHIQGLKK